MIISPTSSRSEPIWLDSPIRQSSLLPTEKSTSVACCLVPNGLAEIRLKHYPRQSVWHVTDDSEVISFPAATSTGRSWFVVGFIAKRIC